MKYDNVSVDGEVGFLEKDHIYEKISSKKRFSKSVTGLIGSYHEEFIQDEVAEKVSKIKTSKYYDLKVEDILASWKRKADEGTELHAYGENLLNSKEVVAPDLPKAKWVPEIVDKLLKDYDLAKTELLVYSDDLDLAGQSDILLKRLWPGDEKPLYSIYDWKFLSKELEMSSYYNPYTRKYKMMLEPFHHLKDCNWIHYSIQLAIYQTLTGAPTMIREKVLVIVNDDEYKLVPAYPMRIFWDAEEKLQAVYEIYNGKIYDSREDKLLASWPKDIKGR